MAKIEVREEDVDAMKKAISPQRERRHFLDDGTGEHRPAAATPAGRGASSSNGEGSGAAPGGGGATPEGNA